MLYSIESFKKCLYIKCSKVSVCAIVRNIRTSITVGVTSSVANDDENENDVIMRTGAASAASTVGARCHNENDITMTIADLWRYGDW